MKANKIEHGNRKVLVGGLLLLGILIGGLVFSYGKLRDLYVEQCEIRDMAAQVEITAGKMVRPGTIAEVFGLKVGANLAKIDFAARREDVLKAIPNLREIRITRRLPDKVFIAAEERTPIARMGFLGDRSITGRVVDADGMVFDCMRGTQTLPTIREPGKPGTQRGTFVKGRTLAALKLVEACRDPEFLELGVLEVDTSKHDFLVVTLGNYSRVKILWDEMDESTASGLTPTARKDLLSRLTLLRNTIRSKVTPDAVIWNATIPGRIFADTQGKL